MYHIKQFVTKKDLSHILKVLQSFCLLNECQTSRKKTRLKITEKMETFSKTVIKYGKKMYKLKKIFSFNYDPCQSITNLNCWL